jgi:hypothetical protein
VQRKRKPRLLDFDRNRAVNEAKQQAATYSMVLRNYIFWVLQ